MKIFQRVLNIGIISSDLTGSVCLMENLKENNVELEYKIPLLELSDSHIKTSAVDVWLVDLDDDDWSDQLDELLDHAATPVFINEQSAISRQKHPQFWVQKLIVRLGELVLEVPSAIEQTKTVPSNNQQSKAREKSTKPLSASTAIEGLENPGQDNPGQDSQPAEKVIPIWVLGASLGGPAALKRFLQTLPENLPVAFILVQHIDKNFIPVLQKILEDYSPLKVKIAAAATQLKAGEILLTPVDKRLTMVSSGLLLQMDMPWTAPYSPCIDDVLKDVSKHWSNSGCIFFSGMGGDGVQGANFMKTAGQQVWTQQSVSCANSAMPDEIRNAGYSDFSGTPEELAQKLVAYIHRQNYADKAADTEIIQATQERHYGNSR